MPYCKNDAAVLAGNRLYLLSGYAAEPNYDNMFAGSNFDAEDFDDYNVLRDMQVDGGLRPVTEEEVIHVRNKAARAVQAVFTQLGLSPVTDAQVEAVTYAHGKQRYTGSGCDRGSDGG